MPISMKSALEWIRIIPSSERINFLCSFLRLIVPLELRFIASYIEDLARLNFNELRSFEIMANQVTEYDNIQLLQLDRKLDQISVNLCLLHSQNSICAGKIFTLLKDVASQCIGNDMPTEDIELVFLLSCHHPAFMYKHRIQLYTYLQDIQANILQKKMEFTSTNAPISDIKENIPAQIINYNSVSCQTTEDLYPHNISTSPRGAKVHESSIEPQMNEQDINFGENHSNQSLKSATNPTTNMVILDNKFVISSDSQNIPTAESVNSFKCDYSYSSSNGVNIQSALYVNSQLRPTDFPFSVDQVPVNNLRAVLCEDGDKFSPKIECITPGLSSPYFFTSQESCTNSNSMDSNSVARSANSNSSIPSCYQSEVIELPVINSSYMLSDFGFNQSLVANSNMLIIDRNKSENTSTNFSCLKSPHTFGDNLNVSSDGDTLCVVKSCNNASIGITCKINDAKMSSPKVIEPIDLYKCEEKLHLPSNSNLLEGLDNKIDNQITIAYVSFPNDTPNLTDVSKDVYNIDFTDGDNLTDSYNLSKNTFIDNKSTLLNTSSQTSDIDVELSLSNMPDLIPLNKVTTTIINCLSDNYNEPIATNNTLKEDFSSRNTVEMYKLNANILQSTELANRVCIDSLDTHTLTQANIVLDSYVNSADTLKDSFRIGAKSDDKMTSCYKGKVISSVDNTNSSNHHSNGIKIKFEVQTIIKDIDLDSSKIENIDKVVDDDKNNKMEQKVNNYFLECLDKNVINSNIVQVYNNLGGSHVIKLGNSDSANFMSKHLDNNSVSRDNYILQKFICPACDKRHSSLSDISDLGQSDSLETNKETDLSRSRKVVDNNFTSTDMNALNRNAVTVTVADENVILRCDLCSNIFCNVKYNVKSNPEENPKLNDCSQPSNYRFIDEQNRIAVECADVNTSNLIGNASIVGGENVNMKRVEGKADVCNRGNIAIEEPIGSNFVFNQIGNDDLNNLMEDALNDDNGQRLVAMEDGMDNYNECCNLVATCDQLSDNLTNDECLKVAVNNIYKSEVISKSMMNRGTDIISNFDKDFDDKNDKNHVENIETLFVGNQNHTNTASQQSEHANTTEQDIKENWDSIFNSLPPEEVDKVLKAIHNLSISRLDNDPNSPRQKSNNIQNQINETILKFKNNYLESHKDICDKKNSVDLNKQEFSIDNFKYICEIKSRSECSTLQKPVESKISTFKSPQMNSNNSFNQNQCINKESNPKMKLNADTQKKQNSSKTISDNTSNSYSINSKDSPVNNLISSTINEGIINDECNKDALKVNEIDAKNGKCLNRNNHNSNQNLDNLIFNENLSNNLLDNSIHLNIDSKTFHSDVNVRYEIKKVSDTNSRRSETNCISKDDCKEDLNCDQLNEVSFVINTSFVDISGTNNQPDLMIKEMIVKNNESESNERNAYSFSESEIARIKTDYAEYININKDFINPRLDNFYDAINDPISTDDNLQILETDVLTLKEHLNHPLVLKTRDDSHFYIDTNSNRDELDVKEIINQDGIVSAHNTLSTPEFEILNDNENFLSNEISDNCESDRPICMESNGEDKVVWKVKFPKNNNTNNEMSQLVNPLQQRVGRPLLGRRWNKDNLDNNVECRFPTENVPCDPPIRDYNRTSSLTNLSECESASNISTDSKHSEKRESISDAVGQEAAVLKSSRDNLTSLPVVQSPQRQSNHGFYQTPQNPQTPQSRPIFRYSYSDMNRMRNGNQMRYRGGDRNYRNTRGNSPPLLPEGSKNFRFVDIGFPRSVAGFYPINNNFQGNVNNFSGTFPNGNNFQAGGNNNFHSSSNNFYAGTNFSGNNGNNYISNGNTFPAVMATLR